MLQHQVGELCTGDGSVRELDKGGKGLAYQCPRNESGLSRTSNIPEHSEREEDPTNDGQHSILGLYQETRWNQVGDLFKEVQQLLLWTEREDITPETSFIQ